MKISPKTIPRGYTIVIKIGEVFRYQSISISIGAGKPPELTIDIPLYEL